jgi:anti-sigma B factor antagonist
MSQASAVRSPITGRECAAAPPFTCSWVIARWGAAWVQVAGEVDLATSSQFRQTVIEAQRAARVVVLDLRELCFIESSGVHVILDAARNSRREGDRLLIVRGPAQIERVLTLTEVCKHVVIFDLAPAEPAQALLHVLPPGVAV